MRPCIETYGADIVTSYWHEPASVIWKLNVRAVKPSIKSHLRAPQSTPHTQGNPVVGNRKQVTSRIISTPELIHYNDNIVGYGSRELRVETISCWLARLVVVNKHYSHRFVNNSYLHLGIFSERELVGVMQWGYALNPNNGARVVTGTQNREYMELNRLWLHDCMPRNSESRAISYALKLIRQLYP